MPENSLANIFFFALPRIVSIIRSPTPRTISPISDLNPKYIPAPANIISQLPTSNTALCQSPLLKHIIILIIIPQIR